MKKLFTFVLIVFMTYSANSQVLIALLLGDKLNTGKIEFGLIGGMNFAHIGNMDSNDWNREYFLGFYFDILLKEKTNWYLNTGVLVKSTLGLDNLNEEDLAFLNATVYEADGDYKQRIGYFLVPAMIKYKFKNNIYAELGLQFGLASKAYIQFDSDIDGNSARIRQTNTDQIHRFDMGVSTGAGYRLLKGLGWTVGARYYYGFLDVYKELKASNSEKKKEKKAAKKEAKKVAKEGSQEEIKENK